MASILFVDKVTVIATSWLNDVNSLVWGVFNGATTAALARTALGLSSTVPLTVPVGGTGLSTITSGALLLGAGTSAVSPLAAGTVGNVVIDNGTTWVSSNAPASFKNKLYNAGMRIDQVTGALAVTVNTAATTTYSIDGWNMLGTAAAGVFTVQQLAATPPAGHSHYLRVTTSTADAVNVAGSIYQMQQHIEGTSVADLNFGGSNAATMTLSFWVRSSLTGTFGGAIQNGTSARSYPFQYTINAANTWEQKTVTLVGDQTGTWSVNTAAGQILIFDIGCGSSSRGTANAWVAGSIKGVTGGIRLIGTLSATLDITGVQYEKGATASSFETLPQALELIRCQRFYSKSFAQATVPVANAGFTGALCMAVSANNNGTYALRYPVVMRTTPTMTTYSTSVAANSNWFDFTAGAGRTASAANGSDCGCEITIASAVAPNSNYIHYTADARY